MSSAIEIQGDIWYVIVAVFLLLLLGLRWLGMSHIPIGILTIVPVDGQISLDSLHLQSSGTAIILERKNCNGWPWKSSTCHVFALWTFLHPEFGVPSTTEVHLWLHSKGSSLTWTKIPKTNNTITQKSSDAMSECNHDVNVIGKVIFFSCLILFCGWKPHRPFRLLIFFFFYVHEEKHQYPLSS